MPASVQSPLKRAITILTLMTAGEGMFLLPFILARVFRPTLLDVFGLTNLQLGRAYTVYGVVALVSYILGGPLADRFAARRLMTAALVATALGGLVFVSIPTFGLLTALYAFWGMTTILLFWAAMIRATREWGGSSGQGRAFGLLEGGRGLLSAILASVAVAIFASLLPEGLKAVLAQRRDALIQVIWIFIGVTLSIAALVWVFVPEPRAGSDSGETRKLTLEGLWRSSRMLAVWLQAATLACAYVSFRCIDDFALYSRDAFGYNDVASARIGLLAFWVRPFAALGAGLLADRIRASRVIAVCYGVLIVGSLTVATGLLHPGMDWALIATVAAMSVGIYAARGVYFALTQEAKIPMAITGSAVGLISLVGYTPDIFVPSIIGQLLDKAPGATGHQRVFAMIAAASMIGLACTLLFQRTTSRAAD